VTPRSDYQLEMRLAPDEIIVDSFAGTRSAVSDAGHYHYAVELTDEEHRRLASVLARVLGAVVLSGYACPLYDEELYRGWDRHEKRTRANGGGDRTEVLWIKPAGVEMDAPLSLVQQPSLLGFSQ
jgi:hypothetical protein